MIADSLSRRAITYNFNPSFSQQFNNLTVMFRYERKWGDGVRSDERKERTEIFLWVER